MIDPDHFGPTLQRLRKSRGLKQREVAVRIGRTVQMVSRIEQPGSNPKLASLLRYLTAIDASLGDLHGALSEQEPDDEIEPPGRAAAILQHYWSRATPTLRALADLIEEQDRRLRALEGETVPREP